MAGSSRRGRILIKPYKQLRFGIAFLILNFIFSVIILSVFAYFLWDIYQAVVFYFQLSAQESQVTLEKFMIPALIALGLVLLFIFLTLHMAVRYTHQFYGPLVSIHRYLDNLLENKQPDPISLRKKDQLQDLVIKLNHLREQILLTSPRKIHQLEEFVDSLKAKRRNPNLQLEKGSSLYTLSMKLNELSDELMPRKNEPDK